MNPLQEQIDKLKRQIKCLQCETGFYDSFEDFPTTGGLNKLYIDKGTNSTYIWDGDSYEILQVSGNEYKFGVSGEDDLASGDARGFDAGDLGFSITNMASLTLNSNGTVEITSVGDLQLRNSVLSNGLTAFDNGSIDIVSKNNSDVSIYSDGEGTATIFNNMNGNGFSAMGDGNIKIISTNLFTLDMPTIGTAGHVITSIDAFGTAEWLPIVDAANDFVDDAAAAIGGVSVGSLYHTSGIVKIRLS